MLPHGEDTALATVWMGDTVMPGWKIQDTRARPCLQEAAGGRRTPLFLPLLPSTCDHDG